MPSLRRILLVRLDGIGDALACIPMLEGLRRLYPNAEFGAVLLPGNAAVYSPQRVVAHVYRGEDDLLRISEEVRNGGYDAAIVATEEVVGYAIARASGASIRIGFWHRFEKPFKSMWQRAQVTHAVYRPAARQRKPEHEVVVLHALARALGADADPLSDPAVLKPWVNADPSGALPEGARTLGVQIAGKSTTQSWGPAALAAFVADAARDSGLPRCVLLAASSDAMLANAIVSNLPAGFRALPPSSTGEWLGAIASLGALITPDTGAAHAAGMLGIPVVDIFDAAGFEELSSRWRPWAAPARCITKPVWRAGDEARFGSDAGAAIKELLALEASSSR